MHYRRGYEPAECAAIHKHATVHAPPDLRRLEGLFALKGAVQQVLNTTTPEFENFVTSLIGGWEKVDNKIVTPRLIMIPFLDILPVQSAAFCPLVLFGPLKAPSEV